MTSTDTMQHPPQPMAEAPAQMTDPSLLRAAGTVIDLTGESPVVITAEAPPVEAPHDSRTQLIQLQEAISEAELAGESPQVIAALKAQRDALMVDPSAPKVEKLLPSRAGSQRPGTFGARRRVAVTSGRGRHDGGTPKGWTSPTQR